MADLKTMADEAAGIRKAIQRFDGLLEEYLAATGFPQTGFGRACGCGIDLVRHIRIKRDLRRGTLLKVLDFIAKGTGTVV